MNWLLAPLLLFVAAPLAHRWRSYRRNPDASGRIKRAITLAKIVGDDIDYQNRQGHDKGPWQFKLSFLKDFLVQYRDLSHGTPNARTHALNMLHSAWQKAYKIRTGMEEFGFNVTRVDRMADLIREELEDAEEQRGDWSE